MTRTHTAADFENAQFAKHPDGQLAHRKVAWPDGTIRQWTTTGDNSTGQSSDARMAFDGWVPVPTKPTITKSQVNKELEGETKDFEAGFHYALAILEAEIIPDPEPTNTERLAELIGRAFNSTRMNVNALAEYLNDNEVTAPNVKDN